MYGLYLIEFLIFYACVVLNVNTFRAGVCLCLCLFVTYCTYSTPWRTINYSVFFLQILLVYWNVYKIAYRRPVVGLKIAVLIRQWFKVNLYIVIKVCGYHIICTRIIIQIQQVLQHTPLRRLYIYIFCYIITCNRYRLYYISLT